MEALRRKAVALGASELARSPRKGKKYRVLYNGQQIHFGDPVYQDFTQNADGERRRRYLARAKGIRDKEGRLTWRDPRSANFWSVKLLWKG